MPAGVEPILTPSRRKQSIAVLEIHTIPLQLFNNIVPKVNS
jgi:hypothetical protein